MIEDEVLGAINTIAATWLVDVDLYSASPYTVCPKVDVVPVLGVVKTVLDPSILCVNPEYVPEIRASGIVPVTRFAASSAPISANDHETLAEPLTALLVLPTVIVLDVPQLEVVMFADPSKLVPLMVRAVFKVVAVVAVVAVDALPASAAVIVPAEKLPEASR